MKFVGAAIIGSVLVYIIAAYVIIRDLKPGDVSMTELHLKIALFGLSVVVAVLSLGIRRFVLSEERLGEILTRPFDIEKVARRPKIGQVNKELLNQLKTMADGEQKIACLLKWYTPRYILMLAFNESIALFGLMAAIASRNLMDMLPFAAVSVVVNILTIIHPKSVLEVAEKAVR